MANKVPGSTHFPSYDTGVSIREKVMADGHSLVLGLWGFLEYVFIDWVSTSVGVGGSADADDNVLSGVKVHTPGIAHDDKESRSRWNNSMFSGEVMWW